MMNEGNSSGVGIACIDEEGNVHADQFWRHYSFGNVRERPFSEIWMDTSNELMAKLKKKKTICTGAVRGLQMAQYLRREFPGESGSGER